MICRLVPLLLLLTWCNVAGAADTSVPQFKAIVGRLDAFFQAGPLIYDVQTYRKSPTGLLIIDYRFRTGPFRYDVKKTDSLITPIVGTVSFNISKLSPNRKCGSIPIPIISSFGAATLEEAQNLLTKGECLKGVVPDVCSMLLTYGYAESKWELRAITSEPAGCDVLINYASGVSTSGRQPSNLNMPWRKLNYGLVNEDHH
jgi:hypothetical protein